MLRDAAEAYKEAEFRVIGCAVSGDAARVLGDEAAITTQTVARLRIDLQNDRERLDGRTVLIVDEASMLGTDDALTLMRYAREQGAQVRFVGDASQHGSVARGAVLEDLTLRHGACDMGRSRRAKDEWLQQVAVDLRAGRTGMGLDALRDHGGIGEYRDGDEAKAALVREWSADVRAGKDVLLLATRRKDVAELNELAREALGDRLGEAREYSTSFGRRTIGVGELLVARHANKDTNTVNGDRMRVVGHRDDGQLECELLRDKTDPRNGERFAWDISERKEVDYGYASTSYRSQGRTVDRVYIYASRADELRGAYVDATRARESVRITYGRDEIEHFGKLVEMQGRVRAAKSVWGIRRRQEELAAEKAREQEASVSADVSPEHVAGKTTSAQANDERKQTDAEKAEQIAANLRSLNANGKPREEQAPKTTEAEEAPRFTVVSKNVSDSLRYHIARNEQRISLGEAPERKLRWELTDSVARVRVNHAAATEYTRMDSTQPKDEANVSSAAVARQSLSTQTRDERAQTDAEKVEQSAANAKVNKTPNEEQPKTPEDVGDRGFGPVHHAGKGDGLFSEGQKIKSEHGSYEDAAAGVTKEQGSMRSDGSASVPQEAPPGAASRGPTSSGMPQETPAVPASTKVPDPEMDAFLKQEAAEQGRFEPDFESGLDEDMVPEVSHAPDIEMED
jgi:AAA domain